MATVKVYNLLGEATGSLKLSDEVFGQEYNEALIHQVIVAQLANARQGTKSALTRSEVRGHAKKPWRQKHTGRARHGSTKGPQWRGGGVVFAPKPRDFSKKINKEAKRVAFRSAISTKLNDKEIVVVENLNIAQPKTKEMVNVAKALNLSKSVLLVTENLNDTVIRATNNIEKFEVTTAELLNVYEIVAFNTLVITKDAIKKIEEAYKG